jgi:signal transduction histidine kinase
MGLASMRDRIRGQFGQLIVESAPGLGTKVEARLPR